MSRSSRAIDQRFKEFIRYAEVKHIAYNVIALQEQKMFRSLAVLSFFPGEGKTLFCAAMAMAYVEASNNKAAVIDTTNFQNKKSLSLGDCFEGFSPQLELLSLEGLRRASRSAPLSAEKRAAGDKMSVIEPDIMSAPWAGPPVSVENDFSLVRRATEDNAKQFRLVLMDTVPLSVRNRGNIDPLLVARTCDASVLIVSRKFLDSGNMNNSLKILEDPSIHLLGMISNEDFSR
jgi:hypothetical protein